MSHAFLCTFSRIVVSVLSRIGFVYIFISIENENLSTECHGIFVLSILQNHCIEYNWNDFIHTDTNKPAKNDEEILLFLIRYGWLFIAFNTWSTIICRMSHGWHDTTTLQLNCSSNLSHGCFFVDFSISWVFFLISNISFHVNSIKLF